MNIRHQSISEIEQRIASALGDDVEVRIEALEFTDPLSAERIGARHRTRVTLRMVASAIPELDGADGEHGLFGR